jgi:hypothetical protein
MSIKHRSTMEHIRTKELLASESAPPIDGAMTKRSQASLLRGRDLDLLRPWTYGAEGEGRDGRGGRGPGRGAGGSEAEEEAKATGGGRPKKHPTGGTSTGSRATGGAGGGGWPTSEAAGEAGDGTRAGGCTPWPLRNSRKSLTKCQRSRSMLYVFKSSSSTFCSMWFNRSLMELRTAPCCCRVW